MDSDGNTKKYKDVYEFFKRISVQTAEFDSLTKAARRFSTSFGVQPSRPVKGITNITWRTPKSLIPRQRRQSLRHRHQLQWSRTRDGLWSHVPVMESVLEEDDENIDPKSNMANDEGEFTDDDVMLCYESPSAKKLNAITASDKLSMACFRTAVKEQLSTPQL